MTRRRRSGFFEVELSVTPDPPADPAAADPAAPGAAPRPGPMAAAVRDTARSLQSRARIEADIRAENDALAHELVRLRGLGLVAEPVSLDRIDAARLIRDRAVTPDPDVADLIASIRDIGLSNPIRLERAGDRFELIQGWRRLAAYRALLAETGDPAWAAIPAAVSDPGADLTAAYRRMVDENLVREDVSFAEMADLARACAADPHAPFADLDAAVAGLFRSASAQKRSYIRAFAQLLEMIGGHLAHPRAIPRNLGLDLRRRLAADPDAREALLIALAAHPDRTEAQELALLREFADAEAPAPGPGRPRRGAPPQRFAVTLPRGTARCTVTGLRATLTGPEDLAGLDRARLERAVAAFYAALDDD